MMDHKIRLQKEIAMGIASKKETAPKTTKVQNKKCGGAVKAKKK